jgi:hypothetical protein
LTIPGSRGVHYGQAQASDATGKAYAVRISNSAGLGLEVDVANATLPLTIDPLIWDGQQKILPSDYKPSSFWPNDFFGRSLAVFDNTLLISADNDDDLARDSGAVYVFTRDPPSAPGLRSRWLARQKLKAPDAAAGAHFGSSLALFGDTALIGAYGANGRGAAYVFVRSGSTWTGQQRLAPSSVSQGARFGASVALSGDNAIVGAPLHSTSASVEIGAAYAFGRAGTAWSELAAFAPPGGAAAGVHFGAAVAIAGDTTAIGRDNVGAGGVDWFGKIGATWSSTGAGVRSSVAHFGSALAMTESNTVIGAYGDASKGVNAGAVSVTSTSSPHAPLVQLTASDGRAGDLFGFSLAISGSTLLIGAPSVDGAPSGGSCSSVPDTGAGYLFVENGATWTQQKKLLALGLVANAPPLPPCDPGITLGTAVAALGQLALLGAPSRTEWGADAFPNAGAVYDYEAALTNGSPCNQASDCFSAHCVEGVCCNAACEGPCLSCSAALKDPAHGFNGDWVTGLCGEVAADTDPKDGCNDMGTTCGTTGECSGYGGCKARNPPGTPCGAGANSICVGPTSAAANSVCVNYTCASFLTYDCQPGFLCQNGSCVTSCKSNADCDAALGFVCKSGLCKLGTNLGGPCSKNNECPTNHCVDGVCCESSCDEACLSCALTGSEGTCLPVSDDPADAPGSCAADDGSAGAAGAAGTGGNGEAGAGGEAGDHATGAGGMLARGEAGAESEAGSDEFGGSGGATESIVECVPACARGMVCNHENGTCADQLVTACGCRQVGGRRNPAVAFALLLAVSIGLARRRAARAR